MIFEDDDDIFDRHLPKRELDIVDNTQGDPDRRGSVNFKSMHTELESKPNRRKSLVKKAVK